MKASQRSRVRLMPRAPHVHSYDTIVSLKGNGVRYGCDSCPAIDLGWYRLMNPLDEVLNLNTPASDRVLDIAARRALALIGIRSIEQAEIAAEALKTTGWLSGSEGSDSDPQGPDVTVHVIEQAMVTSCGPDVNGLYPIESVAMSDEDAAHLLDAIQDPGEDSMQLDPEHPHADTPDVPDYTEEQLRGMKVKEELLPIARDLNVPRRTVLTKDELIAKILDMQKDDAK